MSDFELKLNKYQRDNLGLLLWAIMNFHAGAPLMSGDWNGEVLWLLFPSMTMAQIEEYFKGKESYANRSVEEFEKFLVAKASNASNQSVGGSSKQQEEKQ